MKPAELLADLKASGVVEPIALVRDGAVLLAGEAGIVILCLRVLGDHAMADRCEGYRVEARGFVVALDSATRQVSVDGVPRVALTSAGGVA